MGRWRAGGAPGLLRRVRWGNVGRLAALLAAGLAVASAGRGCGAGQPRPEAPRAEAPGGETTGGDARDGETRGEETAGGRTTGGQTPGSNAPPAPAGEPQPDRTPAKRATPRTIRRRLRSSSAKSGRSRCPAVAPNHAPTAPKPQSAPIPPAPQTPPVTPPPTGEFTPDPGA